MSCSRNNTPHVHTYTPRHNQGRGRRPVGFQVVLTRPCPSKLSALSTQREWTLCLFLQLQPRLNLPPALTRTLQSETRLNPTQPQHNIDLLVYPCSLAIGRRLKLHLYKWADAFPVYILWQITTSPPQLSSLTCTHTHTPHLTPTAQKAPSGGGVSAWLSSSSYGCLLGWH